MRQLTRFAPGQSLQLTHLYPIVMTKQLRTKIIKISIKKIKRINASKLCDSALLMIMSISGNTLVFKGDQPFTLLEIKALIKTFTNKKMEYKLNGLGRKLAYVNAMNALIDAMVAFAPYVNKIAKGNKKILAASTLPTTEVVKEVAKMFREGHVASGIKGKLDMNGKLVTDCTPFGDGVDYIVVVSEGSPLPNDFCINNSRQIVYCGGIANRVFIDITSSRKKTFTGLSRNKSYFIYYIMVFGDKVSNISKCIEV
jgi:hypothetical protein